MSESKTQNTSGGNLMVAASDESITNTRSLIHTRKSVTELETGIAHYPDAIRKEVLWLQGFFFEHCRGNFESLREIACKLGTDKSREYFNNLVGGYYFTSKTNKWQAGGKAWSEFLELLSLLRRYQQQVERTGKQAFVPTPTYHCIANFITAKRAISAVCKIGGVIAPTGGQTSECFKHYRSLNNHGQVIHIEAPANGRLPALQAKILEAYREKPTNIDRHREASVREHVNESRGLIIDNAQVLYQPRHGNDQPCFNWIREIYDDKRPTIILKFTEEFLNDLSRGAAKGYFEQFIGRMGGLSSILRLPDYAPEADLRCITHAFRLPEKAGYEFLHKWSRQQGRIRIVFDKLQFATDCAKLDGRERILVADLKEADEYTPPSIGTFEEGGEL